MPVQFTTDEAPRHQRLARWQDIVCDIFVQLDCKSDLGDAFGGSVTQHMLGSIACTNVASTRQRVFRTPSRIARASEDFILIAVGRQGSGAVLQDGRETVIHAGELAMYDTTRPYELQFNGHFKQTIFQVPRGMLQRRISGTESFTATTFSPDRPLAKLALEYLTAVSGIVDKVDAAAAAHLSDQALDLFAMAICERLSGIAAPSSTHRSALLCRLKAHIQAHLSDPDLSLTATAAALGISPRYVNDLLSDERMSFQRYLLQQRLERCKRDLGSAGHLHRNIGEIAFAWGFNELSHFGRAFRERYGMSPRAWRSSALSACKVPE